MILVTKSQKKQLEKAGLLVYNGQQTGNKDVNIFVANRHHRGRNKKYYITEDQNILLFLGKYEGINLQKLRPYQLAKLINAGLVQEENIQNYGEYKPQATVFIDSNGQIRCRKITAFMIEVGIWKDNKKFYKQSNYSSNNSGLNGANGANGANNSSDIE